jgi:hypothetical protein
MFVHRSNSARLCRQADNWPGERQPVAALIVERATAKNGRKAMYIGIGGLVLLIILLVILL